jgi:two-component system NtrC family sensor kinase
VNQRSESPRARAAEKSSPALARMALARQILDAVTVTASTRGFLRRISRLLVGFVQCGLLELRVRQGATWLTVRATRGDGGEVQVEIGVNHGAGKGATAPDGLSSLGTEQILQHLAAGAAPGAPSRFTESGAFWVADVSELEDGPSGNPLCRYAHELCQEHGYISVAIIGLMNANERGGLLELMSRRSGELTREQAEDCGELAGVLCAAVVSQQVLVALRERVKELTCIYGMSQVADKPGASLAEIMQGIAQLLPPAWQYPDAVAARIVLDGQSYSTRSYRRGPQCQSVDVVVDGERRGFVEVTYAEEMPELDEGPFLHEERKLIDAVAREVALIIERRAVQEEQARLREQLMHADRLATIGQLAAGVAHELNEPLGNILGFAQLAQKCPGLPEQAARDVGKIVGISLYAREIIRELQLFARQMPSKRAGVDLNRLVESVLSFFEARCETAGVDVSLSLAPDVPEIVGDAAQLNQVLVNLVVNALQAMPDGGELAVETRAAGDHVTLAVRDTGVGMTEEVREQVFVPFFTTKDVGEGTGLGLPVVHGIVGAHGGRIRVESKVGHGSLFEVQLPIGAPEETEEGS